MRKTTEQKNPYRNLSFDKIDAPEKTKNQPKSGVRKSEGDLRIKSGRK